MASLRAKLRAIGRPDVIPLIERDFSKIESSGLSFVDVFLAGRIAQIGMPGAVFMLPGP